MQGAFDAVVDLPPPERAAVLDEMCAGDAAMREELESLLAADARTDSFGEQPAFIIPEDLLSEEAEESLAGRRFGVYEIIREIGRGGLGAVYLAARADDEYRKEVALKLIRRGLDTDDILQRFRNERQILAQLDHPNIARLLDGGTSEAGLPYFIMEYVKGEPLLDYCATHQLNTSQRLDLFRKVCAAVSYAHQNLVIHRDLKPSNILVTTDGEPKLLDFGIAKLVTAEEEMFTVTAPGLRAMTPDYASPEQIKGEKITTASDVYSLGVLLYELLSGARPYRLKTSSVEEMYRAITEQEPTKPSAATPDKSTIANRNSKILEGDLDNIVLVALRKEPERRYSSVENLARDIDRHQTGRPVTARPSTFAYRAEKFFKRNRTGVVAGSLIALAIIAGIFATLWQSRVAAVERDRARLEAEKAKKINAYMQGILNFSNPNWQSSNPARNRKATIGEALDEALKTVDADLAGEPEIQAEILLTLGMTYNGQGQYEKAEKLLRRSIENFSRVGAELRAKQASVLLGENLQIAGRHAESEKLHGPLVDYFRGKFAEDKNQARWLAIALNDLANTHNYNSRFAEAEALYREGIALDPYLKGKDRFALNIALGNLAWLLQARGEFPEAFKYFDLALAGIRAEGNEEQAQGGTLYNKMAVAYTEKGDYQQAETYYQKAYEVLLKVFGEEHFYTVSTMYRNAYNLYKQERFDEAETLVEKSLAIQRKIFPNGHNLTAYSERLVGEIHTKKGDVTRGEELLRNALDDLLKKTKEPNRDIALAKLSLGENLIAQKKYAEAEPFISSALDGSIKVVGESHPFTRQCRAVLDGIPRPQP